MNDFESMQLYIDTRFNAADKAQGLFAEKVKVEIEGIEHSAALASSNIDTRFTYIDKATLLEAANTEKRDIKNNEFRQQLADQATKFPTRAEIEAKLEQGSAAREALDTRLQTQEKYTANLSGRFTAVTATIAFLSVVINIALHFIK